MASDEGRWGRRFTPDLLGGDITNPQSLNRYAYALNNPTTLTDPLGLDPSDCTSQIDENGNPYVSCSGPDTVTVNGGEPPSLGLIMCELGFGGCGQTTITGPVTGYSQSGGGGGGGSAPAPKPTPVGLRPPSYGQVLRSFNNCAANFADKYSAASLLHLNNSTVGNALLGSTTAAVSNLIFQTNPKVYVPAGANLAVASKAGAGLKGAAVALGRLETNQGFQSVFTTVAPTTVSQTAAGGAALSATRAVGEFVDLAAPVLIGYDEALYGIGEGACTARAF